MSLPILVIMVVVGIAAIVAAVHFNGGTRAAVLADADAARWRFAADYPGEIVHEVQMAADGRSAFLRLGGGGTGLVHGIGAHQLTRTLGAGDILRVERAGPNGIALALADFTFAGGEYRFASQAGADAVLDMLEGGKTGAARERA
jgi:hypothetical protein